LSMALASSSAADSIERLTRKMVNDCGVSVFRAAGQGSKAGSSLALAIPEVNWALAAVSTISDNSTRRQLRHLLRQEIVGPEIQDARVYTMYQSVVDSLSRQGQLSSGTALWVPDGVFEQDDGSALKETLQSVFGMGLFALGPRVECVEELNQWTQDCTNGNVLRVAHGSELAEMGPSSGLLTVVSHCKVRWEHGFNERLTWPAEFNAEDGRPQLCHMMHQHGTFGYCETNEYRVLSLTTATPNMKVSMLLPHFGSIDERLTDFTVEKLHEIFEAIEPTELKIFLPRFKVDSGCHTLGADLASVGVQDMTQSGKGSMGGVDEGMSIHEVLHRSVLEVDEEGEAAPTVPATFQISCAAKCPDIRFDRPFLVLVHVDDCVMQAAKVSSLADTRLYAS